MKMGPAGLKDKKKYKLDVQMRRMNWNKVWCLTPFGLISFLK